MGQTRRMTGRVAQFGLLAAALSVAGCGVRGGLETPRDTAAPQQTSATAEAGQGKPEGATRQPHKGFILDGLLR
ncbi:MAG: lipoprotein [Pseudomonadota bacterium]